MIVIVCGIPGSGKTTLATGLRDRLADRGRAVELFHSDDYERRTYDRLYEDVAEAMTASGDGVRILDGTFARREWRNRFYRLGEVREVWATASLATCRRRNCDRRDPIPEQGLVSIYSEFEPPRADLEIDTDDLSVPAALDRLESAVLDWLDSP